MLFRMWNLFSTFTVAKCPKHEADIFNESVFALSLIENVAIFYEERTTNSTHFLFSYASSTICTVSHTIQVWGIASFILFRFATTFN